jgi:hypothetical protein
MSRLQRQRAKAMADLFEHERALGEQAEQRKLPSPDHRRRVCELAGSQWRQPVIAIDLGEDVRPAFEVPGRREDGTVIGKRLVRRFFWNTFRGGVNTAASVMGGGAADVFERSGKVTGPANAQALGLADAARAAKSPWLVYSANPPGNPQQGYSPSFVAVIDAGDAPPRVLWQAARPHAPVIAFRRDLVTWPDGTTSERGFGQLLTWPDRSTYEHLIGSQEARASGSAGV